MLVTLSTTHRPASDLGFLLHKHPDRVQCFDVAAGVAHVMYPEADQSRCTAALVLEVDPVELVRSARGTAGEGFSLGQYVNDRPYAASSLLAVTLGKVFATAMKGRCDARPELAATAIPLEIRVPVLPCPGGPDLVRRLFAPLGWAVIATPVELDPAFPEWGVSRYVDLRLAGTLRLAEALSQLYVLLPVLDDAKHYWVSGDEVDKLIRAGGAWLPGHPERELITARYLAHQRGYAAEALARLDALDDRPGEPDEREPDGHDSADRRVPTLAQARRAAILAELASAGATRVVDLGCGEGNLLRELVADRSFTEIVGVDVAARVLRAANRRLRLDELPDQRRVRLLQGSVTYADDRLAGFDAVVLSEVVEHVDPPRLGALAAAVFGTAAPTAVIVTTPNAEYNACWESLPAGRFRHPDHRFEWTRAEFAAWSDGVGAEFGYRVRRVPVGPVDERVGAPTQLAVFTRGA
ncbi:3' terminal RNA ribose 2'-O-methyltransferase Hen1 [Actinophytocola xinjiangensis]|uniref:Small RNA 2'-O-methyltransferase n=1 Tax=Actinophytocola xinjiangensis TaxID=485602 RepID=A0A7Z0WQC5_9PSEU|nr:3' terminal RNA ribose 2'-O-methyltransferase Hen1 [Actinophytocola xinjiangensis]OLF12988.1 3' terminal RNA ribose 2'-O-methyltransferase Hen1 [Actinophytocola xinjiangensis]